jgi:hypothetical protein
MTRNKRRLAWLLLKRRIQMTPDLLIHPHRDAAGQLAANFVACVRLLAAMLGRPYGRPTEIERRAVRNSRRRLQEKIR